MIGTLARKSLRARWGRNLFVGLAIAFGVSFVAGSFVLADSMRTTFDELFDELVEGLDLQVRSRLEGVDITDGAVRDALPDSLVPVVADVPGVALAQPDWERLAQVIDADGDPLPSIGAPQMGVGWYEPFVDSDGAIKILDGVAPVGPDQVAIDDKTVDKAEYGIGDTVPIILADGVREFTLVGVFGRSDGAGLGGASVSAFDPEFAAEILGAAGTVDTISVLVADGADVAAVQQAISEVLPATVEVVTGDQVAEESKDAIGEIISAFGTGLLVFALVTAFVSAFIINNIFGITIGQRLREMALLRAVGANGRQVKVLVIAEALAVAVVATIVGIFGGLLVASGLIGIFNAVGAGFPDIALEMRPRTVVVSVIVGIGTALASVVIPARRASRIPPVAAMRPEIGYTALSTSKRLVGGAVVTALGVTAFLIGLFVRPGGSQGLALFGGGGALLTFLGVASLSATVAYPISRAIGAPLQRLNPVVGRLARDNASRNPKRTARTASALMIGVALISAASVFAYSLRDSFNAVLERSLTADYFVMGSGGMARLPAEVGETLAELPEVGAISPIRGIWASLADADGDTERLSLGAVDPVAFPQLVNLDVQDGSFDRLAADPGQVMVYRDWADDRGLGVGDPLEVVYQNGAPGTLTIAGLFDDNSLGGSFYISLAQLEQVSDQPPADDFLLARLADGVTPEQGTPALEAALEAFPQAQLQSNAEFRAEISAQIDQLLVMITSLLGVAILLSFFGIAVTLAMAVFERTREIGLLRAIGMGRRQLRRSIRWEAVIVAVFGVVVGAALGLGMGTALTMAVPSSVISEVAVPWAVLVIALVLAVGAALVAATYPAYKASRMDVLEAIATD